MKYCKKGMGQSEKNRIIKELKVSQSVSMGK